MFLSGLSLGGVCLRLFSGSAFVWKGPLRNIYLRGSLVDDSLEASFLKLFFAVLPFSEAASL
jgi:hypothetical protein